MNHVVEVIITAASVVTALGVIFGILFAFFKWLMKRDKNDVEIREIKEETNDPHQRCPSVSKRTKRTRMRWSGNCSNCRN